MADVTTEPALDQQAAALLTRLPWAHPIAIELRRRFRGEGQSAPAPSTYSKP